MDKKHFCRKCKIEIFKYYFSWGWICIDCARKESKTRIALYREKNPDKYKKIRREHTQELRELSNKLKNVPCKDCGNRYPPYVMDFDHILGKKEFTISTRISGSYKKEQILEEAKKCEIVCSNCHRQRTYNRSRKEIT